MKVLEVITTAFWRRISLNWKWIKEQEDADGQGDVPDTATPTADPLESLAV